MCVTCVTTIENGSMLECRVEQYYDSLELVA